MSTDKMVFNGINGATGGYLLPALTKAQLAQVAQGKQLTPEDLEEVSDLSAHTRRMKKANFRVAAGVDPKSIAESGWGIIFPKFRGKGTIRGEDAATHGKRYEAIREALAPLIEHRRAEAARIKAHRFKELTYNFSLPRGSSSLEEAGRLRTESKYKFFGRQEPPVDGNAAVDPDKFPYYLLLVGSPEEIPYRFQYQLDVQYAVGRLHFDTVEEYANYARSVVAAETSGLSLGRRMAMWGPCTRGDRATELSTEHLLTPLGNWLNSDLFADAKFKQSYGQWSLDTGNVGGGTKAQLGELIGGARTPALLMTASHGLYYPTDHPLHRSHTGALLCQDWAFNSAVREQDMFGGSDIASDAQLAGLIAFHFACYGAGIPGRDSFSLYEKGITRKSDGSGGSAGSQALGQSFVAQMPQRMLGHPKGGALAVIGHVDRAWGSSFFLSGRRSDAAQLSVFRSTLQYLLEGYPVGCAMDFFNERYAATTSDLANAISEYQEDGFSDDYEDEVWMADRWLESNDARNYSLIGDPAVRVRAGDDGGPSQLDLGRVPDLNSAPAADEQAVEQAPAEAEAPIDEAPDDDAPRERPDNAHFGIGDWFKKDDDEAAEGDGASKEPGFFAKLGQTLSDLATDLTTLEVRTYTSSDIAEVASGKREINEVGDLRAWTRIALDGDTDVCVPTRKGKVDEAVWTVHKAMVEQAQQHRTEMLKTLIGAVSGFWGGKK